jgi:hypothetical protein
MRQTLDMTPRYLPEVLGSVGGPGKVYKAMAFPPGEHPPACPLIPECTAVCAWLDNGRLRWFGCEKAYIDSHLRMVVVGTNPLDEIRMKWEVAAD